MNRPPFFRGRPRIWLPLLILIAMPVVFLVRADSDAGISAGAAIGLTVVIISLATIAVQLVRVFVGDDPDVPRVARHLAFDPDQQRLLSRWLLRARRARNIGGICGLTVWFLATQARGDLLLCGVGGIALGAMLAELHFVRPQRGRRTASLDIRALDHYLTDHDRDRMIGVAGAAVVLIGVAATVDGFGVAAVCGMAALVVLGSAHLVQRRVASRPRPAIAESLRHADDLARELAIGRGLAQPAIYFGLALLARGAFSLSPELGVVAALIGAAAWAYAFILWWRNRRLGLDYLLESREPVLA